MPSELAAPLLDGDEVWFSAAASPRQGDNTSAHELEVSDEPTHSDEGIGGIKENEKAIPNLARIDIDNVDFAAAQIAGALDLGCCW